MLHGNGSLDKRDITALVTRVVRLVKIQIEHAQTGSRESDIIRRGSREKKNVREKKTPRQTAGNRKGNRIKQKWRHQKFKEKEIEDKRASRQRDGIRTSWQEERAPRERNVKGQEFQEMTPSTAVAARRSGVVPIGFPFSLQASRPFETFAGPGSTGTYVHVFFVMIYMYIYICLHTSYHHTTS